MKNFNKVVGIGLPKTGTGSLNVVLCNNGIFSVHFGNPECDEIRAKMYRGVYKFDLFEKYRGITNAFEMIFPQVDKGYPNSKFIHTVRDKDAWLISAETHWEWMLRVSGVEHAFIVHNHLITFGTYLFNKDRFAFVYDMHFNMVKDYFKGRENDLLTIDISKDNNYPQKVCGFLGIPLIDNRPIHTNRAKRGNITHET